MLSPAFYVHDLHVHDITTIPPKSSGRPSIPIQMTRRLPGRNHIPATTLLSFYRRKLFNVIYANPALVLDLKGDPKVVEVKMRLKMHAADIRMRIPRLVLCLPYSKMTEAQPLTQDHKNALEEYVYDTRGHLMTVTLPTCNLPTKGGHCPPWPKPIHHLPLPRNRRPAQIHCGPVLDVQPLQTTSTDDDKYGRSRQTICG